MRIFLILALLCVQEEDRKVAPFPADDKAIDQVVFSPDGRAAALRWVQGAKSIVIKAWTGDDGRIREQRSERYDQIEDIRFAPDGRSIYYWARKKADWILVMRGEEGEKFGNPTSKTSPVFNTSGTSYYYTVKTGFGPNTLISVVQDQKIVGKFKRISGIRFASKKGELYFAGVTALNKNQFVFGGEVEEFDQVAWNDAEPHQAVLLTVKKGKRAYAIVDGVKSKPFEDVRHAVVSPDGKQIAYAGWEGVKRFVVLNQKRQANFEDVHSITFSEDGKKIAYIARLGGKWMVVFGKSKGPGFTHVERPVISANGRKVGYVALNGKENFVIVGTGRKKVDGKPGDVTLSSDGKKYAFAVRVGRQMHVVSGKTRSPEYDKVYSLEFTENGETLVYQAERGGQRFFVIGDRVITVARTTVLWIGGRKIYKLRIVNEKREQKDVLCRNGVLGTEEKSIGQTIRILSDGTLMYEARDGDRHHVVAGTQRSDAFEQILWPEGEAMNFPAFAGRIGDRWSMMIGTEAKHGYERVGPPVFSPDGTAVAWCGFTDGRGWLFAGGAKKDLGPSKSWWGLRFNGEGTQAGVGVRVGNELWWKVVQRAD